MITPERGKVYVIHHSSGNIQARFIAVEVYTPMNYSVSSARQTTHYRFQNLKTARDIVIKSRVKIRREVGD